MTAAAGAPGSSPASTAGRTRGRRSERTEMPSACRCRGRRCVRLGRRGCRRGVSLSMSCSSGSAGSPGSPRARDASTHRTVGRRRAALARELRPAPPGRCSCRAIIPTLLVTWGLRPAESDSAARAPRTGPSDRVRVVLSHELAHIQRGDWLMQMLAELAPRRLLVQPADVDRLPPPAPRKRAGVRRRRAARRASNGSDYASHLLELARAFARHRAVAARAGDGPSVEPRKESQRHVERHASTALPSPAPHVSVSSPPFPPSRSPSRRRRAPSRPSPAPCSTR